MFYNNRYQIFTSNYYKNVVCGLKIQKKIQLVNLNLIYGPPCKNRTYDRPLGGARYIHLTNEGYINILYIKNNKIN